MRRPLARGNYVIMTILAGIGGLAVVNGIAGIPVIAGMTGFTKVCGCRVAYRFKRGSADTIVTTGLCTGLPGYQCMIKARVGPTVGRMAIITR